MSEESHLDHPPLPLRPSADVSILFLKGHIRLAIAHTVTDVTAPPSPSDVSRRQPYHDAH